MLKNTSSLLTLSYTALLLTLTVSVQAKDGKALHNEKCISCHQSNAYTRENHKVTNLTKLGGQVSMCSQNLNTKWFPDEEKSVVKFLNTEYYHFK